MKRPPGLWLLLSAGVLWLTVQNVHGIKATSLIFGRTTTTTAAPSENATQSNEEGAAEVSEGSSTTETVSNVTKPTLTGIPQIDYVWDPNLPRELNGYNLTDYPFYDRVPEDIDFKCDGLHDGFYASVPHKCQVYHHCLFGTRYDFLCANYTAFDQKTFICHFVSEVDCVNSKKFWHRNDALYKSASTTTLKPPYVHTPPPHPPAILQTATAAPSAPAAQPVQPPPPPPRRPLGGRRQRPLRRRRPQYDYYDYEDYELPRDDYYEEPRAAGNRRKRPRPRPRPIYDDEYEEYEEELYERRRPSRRPYDRRGYDDRRPSRRRNNKHDRRNYDDMEDEAYEDDPPRYNRRGEDRKNERRREEEPRPNKKPESDKRRPVDDEEELPRKTNRRPIEDSHDEGAKSSKEEPPIIKPASGSSVYDRPRTAPKILPPVPKNVQAKFAYKPAVTTPEPKKEADEEYYDYYEDELPAKESQKGEDHKRPPFKSNTRDERNKEVKQMSQSSRPRGYSGKRPQEDSYEEMDRPIYRRPLKRPKYGRESRYGGHRKRPVVEEDYYDEEYEDDRKGSEEIVPKGGKQLANKETKTTSTTTTTTVATTTKEIRPDAIIRIVKRPFLPSRGGNPYSSRGLQPVGTKAEKSEEVETTTIHSTTQHVEEVTEATPSSSTTESPKPSTSESVSVEPTPEDSFEEVEELAEDPKPEEKVPFKPSPQLVKVPIRPNYNTYIVEDPSQADFRPATNRPETRTTPKPKEKNPLDINENEYDVTLNEALNPTLPNLPIRAAPTGFSSASDLTYRALHRPRFVVDSGGLHQEGSDYSYDVRTPAVYNSGGGAQYVNANTDYTGQYSHITPTYRQSPRLTQAQTRGYFPGY